MPNTFAPSARIVTQSKKKKFARGDLQGIMRSRYQSRIRIIPISQVRRASDDRIPQVSSVPVWRRIRQRQPSKMNFIISEGRGLEQGRSVKVKCKHRVEEVSSRKDGRKGISILKRQGAVRLCRISVDQNERRNDERKNTHRNCPPDCPSPLLPLHPSQHPTTA